MTRKNLVFSLLVLFLMMVLYFIFWGVPGVPFRELNVFEMFLMVSGVSGIILFWLIMLADFFNNDSLQNRIVWGFCLIFCSWLAAIIYFLKVFLPRNK